MSRVSLLLVLPLLVSLALVGCGPTAPPAQPAGGGAGEGHDHDHDHHHDHDHALGPNGGHIVEMGARHVEWLHDDKAEKVTFVILDEAMKNEVSIAATSVSVQVADPGKAPRTFEIPATNAQDGMASRFEVVDGALIVALKVGEHVTLHVPGHADPIKIEHEEHDHHHGHKH